MISVHLQSIGLAAPGLPDWRHGREVLAGRAAFVPADLPPYAPRLLPPNERRRATPAVRQAFRAAEDAVGERDPSQLATVFAGSDGDMAILHRICAALAQPEKVVSPTDFHNSVHNAAAGYWGIATGCRAPSTTLAGYDGSFALGLLEAAVQTVTQNHPTLLVSFDVPAPMPLYAARPLRDAASCALLLVADPAGGALARLGIVQCDEAETVLDDAALESHRRGNPALRALPLLRLLAVGQSGRVVLPGSGGRNLLVEVFA
jgi:hypothetical protein